MKSYLLLSIILLSSFVGFGQNSTTGTSGTIEKSGDVNFTDLANYYKLHPMPLVRKPMFDEDGDHDAHTEHIQTDPSKIKMIQQDAATGHSSTSRTTSLPVSPAPTDTFLSSASDFTSIPPDTHGAVDSTYCVSAINDSIVIRKRTGAFVSGMTLDGFWSTLETHGTGAYDPRIHYDPYYKRWIFVTDCYGGGTGTTADYSTIFIAVSATGNPTGTWHMYKLLVGDASGDWLDFPCVGFNNKWVAVTGNIFSSAGSFNNDALFVFNYANLMSGSTLAYTELLPGSILSGSFCMAPALTYDTAEPNLYAVEQYNESAGQLQLWKVSGPVGSPVLTTVANPATTTHWKYSNNGSDFAPQLGTTDKLQTNDDRINNLQQRNGNLWCAHTVFLPATGTITHTSAMWWEIDTTGTPLQNGMVNDATAAKFYAFPSIAVNINGDALMGFAAFSATTYPSAAYALHMGTDPVDSMRPLDIFRHGQKSYYQTFGGSDNRWGDYSGTCIDPRNNVDFWTIQESVPNYSGGIANSIWDTWWAYVQLCTTTPGAASAIHVPTVICSGSAVAFTTPTVTGAASYAWTIAGTGWSLGASATNSVTATTGTGTATITVTPLSTCNSSGTPYTITTIAPAVTPTVTFSVGTHTVTTHTNDVFTYTGTAVTGGTYSWNFGGGTATPGGTAVGPQTVQWTSSGVKTITLSVTNGGCTSAVYTTTVLVTSPSGVQSVSAQEPQLTILPNPNGGTFDILFGEAVNDKITVKLIDMQGRVVYSNVFGGTTDNKVDVITNNLAPGNYTVNVSVNGGGITNHKITIRR